jgi:uncharacterized protein YdiU (UPF0061 family)
VERDPFYDGNSLQERCTIISRIAPNFFRFGSLEIFKMCDSCQNEAPSADNQELKKKLLDHILLYYPELLMQFRHNAEDTGTGDTGTVKRRSLKTSRRYELIDTADSEMQAFADERKSNVEKQNVFNSQCDDIQNDNKIYTELLNEIVKRTATLVAK